MSPSQIRAVVFDVGGVLVVNPIQEFDRVDQDYGLRPGTAMSFFRGGSLFAECETGKLPFADFCAGAVAEVLAEQGIKVPPARLEQMMNAIMGDTVDPSMRALVLELKAAGLRIGVLSNIYRELDGWLRGVFPPGTIDLWAPSYEIGQRKPDPAAYTALIELAGLPPEQIAFIDDFPENVKAAEAEGIHAILFTGEDDLRRALRELGLAVAAPV